ncbi:hypothetical protein RJT34_19411 [Clitoria ternatea]|uniref:Uncharacterized protein n=1 Tax=Clitoria ternatea TaxID=43366 RepID=A0AAN9P4C7_CLITE
MSEESSQPSDLIMQEKTVNFPVTVKRKTLPNTLSRKTMKANGSDIGSTSTKKKRAAWSEEEDMLLREAVQRWGEGHWAEMAKREDFPIKKSTSQMSKFFRPVIVFRSPISATSDSKTFKLFSASKRWCLDSA